MRKARLLWGFFVVAATCFGQGIPYQSNVFTSANSAPPGSQTTMFTVPFATITVCGATPVGNPCTNTVVIYSNATMSVTAHNPITADVHGRFNFWAPSGIYSYNVKSADGTNFGNFYLSLGGSGGGSAISLQHNGTAVANQNVLNFNDTTPAAPSGSVNVTFGSDSTGKLSAWVPISASSFTLTTTGTSGPATYASSVLNIPDYTYTLTVPKITALGTLTNDISGSAAKWGGIAGSGTPSVGQVPVATGSGTATWQTISATGGISGQTTNCVLKANTATSSNGSAAICDNGTTITATEPVAVTVAGGQGGTADLTEGTAATATAGHDVLYADSTSHCIKYSANGGAYGCLGTGGSGASFIDQVAGYPSATVRAPSINQIQRTANRAITLNRFTFNDNTDGYHAGLTYTSCGMFVGDTMLSMLMNPSYFTAAQKLNFVNKVIGAKNGSGEFPICVAADGTSGSSSFYSAWDAHHAHATGDGWISVPIVLWLYYQQTGDLTPYTANVAAIKTALAAVPENGTNHLVTVVAGDEYVPSLGFQEQQRFNSDVAWASVFKAFDMYVLGQMATAAGDSTNATFFNGRYASIAPAIVSEFTDATSHMLNAASAGQNVQIDNLATTFAEWLETQASGFSIIGSTQKGQIAAHLVSVNSTNLNNGFVREFEAACGTIGMIPAGGGPPYTSSPYTNTQYQCGHWGFPIAAYTYALNQSTAGAALIGPMLQSFNNFGIYNTTEWLNVGSSAPQGDTELMTTPQGAVWADLQYPADMQTNTFSSSSNFATPINISVSHNISGTYFPENILAPNIASGSFVGYGVGQSYATNDVGYLRFKFTSDGSTSNCISLGMFNNDDMVKSCGDGNTTIANTLNASTVTAATTVNTPLLALSNPYSGSGFSAPATILEPSAATGAHTGFFVGTALGTLNSGYLTFWNVGGSGSTSNKLSLGFFGADDLFTIDGNGYANASGGYKVAGAAPSGHCLVGNGTAYVDGTCGAGGSSTVASAEAVTFSATPTFSTSTNVSRIVLTGSITSFTLGAGADGQDKKLCFKQGAGPYTVTPPAGVHGFFTIGTTNGGWNCQSFAYDSTDSIWLATGPGATNE